MQAHKIRRSNPNADCLVNEGGANESSDLITEMARYKKYISMCSKYALQISKKWCSRPFYEKPNSFNVKDLKKTRISIIFHRIE